MENTPADAAGAAPASQTEATPITNSEPAQAPAPVPAPDMHGFSSDELSSLRTWLDSNGGFEKLKSRLSNPQNYQSQAPAQASEPSPTSQPQAQPVEQPVYKAPDGSITAQEFLAQQYFQGLSRDPKYEGISEDIASGNILKEMASFNIAPLNQDGSINDKMVRQFLDLKAQTVPAKGTSSEPDASTAPTVEYVGSTDGSITDLNQAYAIIQQDAQLKAQGMAGHPNVAAAEEFVKKGLNPAQ